METLRKEFKPTSWSIDNKTSIYVMIFILAVFGLSSYNNIPKEQFPEIVIPTMIVTTIYPGTSPVDMENLVTRPIEKQIKSINGVKKISSNSVQDFSSIIVEFGTNVDEQDAKQKVKDAVDKAKSDLPNNLLQEPTVTDINIADFPIMNINLSGPLDLSKIKSFAEIAQDKIEALKEITRVDLIGALDREIKVEVDMMKMQAAGLSFRDVENAVAFENMTISGGSIDIQGMTRSIRIVGEFKEAQKIENIILRNSSGGNIPLGEIAAVIDGFKEKESFARLNGENVITLNVVKKSGQNLLEASDKIKEIIADLQATKFPKNLNINISGDQSNYTRSTLEELNNTIILGFIFVTIVLMFFMGLTNAIFVALSVPLSMALAYIVMPWFGFTMNMLVMFSFIFALGIVVDDAIVVIENTHRIFKLTRMSIVQSAKFAAGEVFLPILSGTLTTLAPFFPLTFWPGTVGKFMFFIPVTLIITLFASLIVAYIINPVFAIDFMKHEDEEVKKNDRKKIFIRAGIIVLIGFLINLGNAPAMGNFIIFIGISYLLHIFFGQKIVANFQKKTLPNIMNKYEKLLRWCLNGRRPAYLLTSVIVALFLTFIIVGIAKPKVEFFPDNEPNTIEAFISLPIGTDVDVTDSVAKIVEGRINHVLGKENPLVESVITNVALRASENEFDNQTISSHKAKVTINFVKFVDRHGKKTNPYISLIRDTLRGISGTEITVSKNRMGPPTGAPVNIEFVGDDLEELNKTSQAFKVYLDSQNVVGFEDLKTDFQDAKPEVIIEVDRERANNEGISIGQIGSEIRTAVLGKEISKFRDKEEQYPIQLRFDENTRKNIDKLLNHKISYRDMASGLFRQIPLASVAKVRYTTTYGSIKRKNLSRVVTLSSNLLTGYTAPEVNQKIQDALNSFQRPESIEIKITGEQEDTEETSAFLGQAMLLSLFLILFIMITQFNNIIKPLIILSEVLFSIIGVLLGIVIFKMTISIIMTGMGIIALAGIVVRNGILIVEFIDVMRSQGLKAKEAIIQAGKIRITPVFLTAAAAILGLIPLAFGFNMNFETLFSDFNPNIHIGGDNTGFFGPLAWAIIFGLSFATFLTLIMVPVMYYLGYKNKLRIRRWTSLIRGKKLRNTERENGYTQTELMFDDK